MIVKVARNSLVKYNYLTIILVEFWGFRFVMGAGSGVSSHCVELVRIMRETWNLVCESINIRSFRKHTFQYQDPLNFADVSMFWKKRYFLTKIVSLLKAIVWELCERFLSSVMTFCNKKCCYWWKCKNHIP